MKKVLLYHLFAFSVFGSTGFAQQNLQESKLALDSAASFGSMEGYEVCEISGDLAAGNHYILVGAETQDSAKDYYIKFHNLKNAEPYSATNIYLGANGDTNASYYGNLVAEIYGGDTSVENSTLTLDSYIAGPYVKANASIGNVKTTISGDVNFNGTVYGGAYVYGGGKSTNITATQQSIVLNITGGVYSDSLWGAGIASNYGKIKVLGENLQEGVKASSVSITNATFNGTNKFIAAGAYSNDASTGAIINGGTSIYLGAGANIGKNYVLGGSYGFKTKDTASTSITGGSIVVIDGATIGAEDAKTFVFGGSYASGSSSKVGYAKNDYTTVDISSGTLYADVYGGSWAVNSGGVIITGDTSVKISGGDINSGNIYGGSFINNNGYYNGKKYTYIGGNTNVEITGGTFAGDVFGGSNVLANHRNDYGAVDKIKGSTNVNISGENTVIKGVVYGGFNANIVDNGNENQEPEIEATIAGSANINVSGGTIMGGIVAGSCAKVSEGSNAPANLTISSAKIVISGGKIYGDILATGVGTGSVITGNSEVIFIGDGSNIIFNNTIKGDFVYSDSVAFAEDGHDTILSFGDGENAFIGTFNGTIENMEIVSVKSASDVTFTQTSTLNELTITSDSKVNLTKNTTFEKLLVEVSDDIMETETFDLGVVLSGISNIDMDKVSVQNANGEVYTGTVIYSAQVPEPSTYAAILGALAFVLGIYRRRK